MKTEITQNEAIKELEKPLNKIRDDIFVKINENFYNVLNFSHDDKQVYFSKGIIFQDMKTYSIPVETTTKFYK